MNTPLGLPAPGLYAISNPLRQFAIAKTIEALTSIGAEWHGRHPNASIGIGDISKHGGGPFPPHAGHKREGSGVERTSTQRAASSGRSPG